MLLEVKPSKAGMTCLIAVACPPCSLLRPQGQLGNELALVGGKVSAVSDQVGFSNHAILLLCGALSEMAKRVGISNGKYVRELEHLSRSVATTGLPAGAMGASGALPAMMVSARSWVELPLYCAACYCSTV